MGYHGENNQDSAQALGIALGLVALRREELLLSGTFLQPIPAAASQLPSVMPEYPELERPPTRRSFKAQTVELLSKGVEVKDSDRAQANSINLTELLKDAISEADNKYAAFCKDGSNRRSSPGWFSMIRHSSTGVKRANKTVEEFQALESAELILEQMHAFFHDSQTRFHNHSFTSYLLDELNTLLESHHFNGSKPDDKGKSYNTNDWAVIYGQLQELAMQDEHALVMAFN